MDKSTFEYDVDILPVNHIYYYIIAALFSLKGTNRVDFSKTLHYMINIMLIVYRNSEDFENLPPSYYDKIFKLVDCINRNRHRNVFYKEIKVNANDQTVDSEDIYTQLTPKEVLYFSIFNY